MSAEPQIELIDPCKDPLWDQFVLDHPLGLISHTSKWKSVLENSFSHMKGHYFVIKDVANSRIRAALPIYEVKSWLLGNRLVSIPFATICDVLISNENDFTKLLTAVLSFSEMTGTREIELKTLLSSRFIKDGALHRVSFYKHHYLELDGDHEEIKKKFHKKSVKSAINKSLKSNLMLNATSGLKELDIFYRLYFITRKRLNLPPQPYLYFKNIWEKFSGTNNFQIILCCYEDHPVAGLAFFKFKNRVSTEFAGWDKAYYGMKPNHFLYWEAIKIACREGFEIFDFGRTSPNNKGLMNFKRHWGTKEVDLPDYYMSAKNKSESTREESKAYQTAQKVCSILPASLYKAFGKFCYRHMG